jgi:hypothetical protein
MSHRKGDHKFVCDIDGQTYHSRHKRLTWDGKVVHYLNYYTRPMLDFYKAKKENTSVNTATGDDVVKYTSTALLDSLCYLWDGTEYVVDEDDNNIEGCPWPTSGGF